MNVFIGTIHAKTDVKGRVFVPASFRKILQSMGESRLVLRKDIYQDCLVLHPEKLWETELNKLLEQLDDWGDEKKLNTLRTISAFEETAELDPSGRLLIPKKYLQAAKITNAVCFVGTVKSIEIWNPDRFIKAAMDADDLKVHVRKYLSKPGKTDEKND